MPITQNQLKFFKSTNNLGGAITATEVVDGQLHGLFDEVSSTESLEGDTEYRCIYVSNTHPTLTLQNAAVLLTANTVATDQRVFMGLGTASIGSPEQVVANESTSPIGVTFTDLIGSDGLKTIGDIPAGSYKAVWFKRVISPLADVASAEGFTLSFQGGTAA